MMWIPFKKKKQKFTISEEAKKRISDESIKLGKPQILELSLDYNQNGVGCVLVGFSEKRKTDPEWIRWKDNAAEEVLSLGELRFELGKFYFFPNIDLVWEKTPHPLIQKITSNYKFSEEPIYLESKDIYRLRSILRLCFQKEGVISLYMKGNICQLEIPELTKEKEERISEDMLTYLSSLYLSPWEE